MSGDLLARLSTLFEDGHRHPLQDLRLDPRITSETAKRPAAVLIAVTARAKPGVLLTHRPEDMRAHPGQAAFPGGKIDAGETPVQAALREANEELGIDPAQVRVIGETDRYHTGSGFDIVPVLAMIPPDLPLVPNPAEVTEWFEPPLEFLLDPANHRTRSAEFQGQVVEFGEIVWEGHRIWGVTAAIIANLAQRLAWRG